jgi:hypothetical protein
LLQKIQILQSRYEKQVLDLLPKFDRKEAKASNSCSEYAPLINKHMLFQEKSTLANGQYMKKQTDITESMRAILVDWLIDVHHKFKLLPETLFLTVNIIDRYLSAKTINRTKL